MEGKKIFRIDKGTMKRSLNVLDVFSIGYGDLGSSIYYALGITALYALGATPIALLLAGIVFIFTALTYAEMSSVIVESGGSASFSRKAFNDLVSFFAGWALLLDYIVTIAISAFSVGPYLKYFIPVLATTDWNISFTILIIAFLLLLNIIGTKHSTRFSSYLTVATIVTQFLVIIFGFFTIVNFASFFKSLAINSTTISYSPDWGQFFKGVAMAMVAYTGIESMAQLSSETKQPAKSVPKAMMIVTVILILSYMGLSTVALSAMNPNELATTYIQDPVAGITERLPVIGKWMSTWIGLLGGIILFAAANSGLIGASRVSFNLGEYCQLPKIFYFLHPKFKTPLVSLLVFAGFAILIVIWSKGSLSFLADLYNFGAQLSFLSAHLALVMHRVQFPNMKRPFKIPFNIKIKGKEIPITAILGAILNLTVWLMVVITKKEGRELGLFWLFLGFILYALLRKKYRIGMTQSVEVKLVKMEDFEKLDVKKILVPLKAEHQEETMKVACEMAAKLKAQITVLYVTEVPYAIPLHFGGKKSSKKLENLFEKAEAIAKEYHLHIDLKQIVSRSISRTIVELSEEGDFELIVLGSNQRERKSYHLSSVVEKVMKNAKCKVWICQKEQN